MCVISFGRVMRDDGYCCCVAFFEFRADYLLFTVLLEVCIILSR